MSKSRPVRWKEGLFLRPHHFQRHELDAEGRVAARLRALAPFGWGVARVEVDPVPLDNFRLEVAALEGVLPDGTVIDLPGAARLPGRSFEALMAEAGRPLDVFVGVRRLEERSPQTAEEDAADGGARYVVRRIEVADLETGGDPQTVEFLDLNLRLIFGGEPADGFDLLPIARLVRTGDRAHPAALDARFAPPALLLSAAPAIHAPARAVVERLATVMRALADVRGGQDPAAALLHQALGGAQAALRELCQDGACHPREAYLELARLAGSLLHRDEQGRSVDDIPPYDHRDPAPVFERLRQLVVELSEPLFARRYIRTKMDRAGDLFRCLIPPEAKKVGARLLIEANAAESAPRLRGLFVAAKISTPERVETLTRHALPGIFTEPLSSPPPELPPGQSGSFFRLRIEEGTEWASHGLPADELGAFLLSCPADVSLALVTLLPEN